MKKIKPVRSHSSALFYKRINVSIGASDNLNKNVNDNVKISEEGKKKIITGQIMACLMENNDAKGM